MMRLLIALLALALLPSPIHADPGVHFKGTKADPRICKGEGDDERCCGHLSGTKEVKCRGSEFLHPALRPVAACLVKALGVKDNPEVCEGGLRESFRTAKLQEGYKSVPAGMSFHNYGLALDVCSYFKSGDCSDDNLVNKVLGGLVKWTKGGKVRCQALYRKKGESGPSKDVVAKVLANPHYPQVLAATKGCFQESSVPYGDSNWGALWKDYFDAPHFQYFASRTAGYYKKKKARTGPHVFVRLLADCYQGDRKALLEDLYAQDPVAFVRARKDGCGAEANELFDGYIEESYPGGFVSP